MKNRNLKHSDNWATPKDLYDKLDAEFHFDFDPCPLNEGEITHDKDGLLEAFVKRAIEKSLGGALCVMLLPVSTSTKLFHEYIQPNAKEIRFVRGRIAFKGTNTFGQKVGKGSAPMHDSMIVIFNHVLP